MNRKILLLVVLVLLVPALLLAKKQKDQDRDRDDRNAGRGKGEVVIVQLSDLHIGLGRAPDAVPNLRRAVDMIAAMNPRPDAVIVSGDIGEKPGDRDEARGIVKWVKAPVYYIPGNHDDNWNTVGEYRSQFGDNYYKFNVGFVTFLGIDSQLLGNFDHYDAPSPEPLPPKGQREADQQFDWLSKQADALGRGGQVVIAVQHVPNEMDSSVIRDTKPYWHTQEPGRSREIDLLKKAGVHDILCGHWHHPDVFNAGGMTYRVAPATSWLTWGGKLGYAVHHISPDGRIRTEFVYLDGSREDAR